MSRRSQKLALSQTPEEGLVVLPFKFQVNGTSDPNNAKGDIVKTWTRSGAGKFTGTLRDKYAVVFGGFAAISATADNVDIYGQVDSDTTGTVVVKTKTGATNTDPADDVYVGGFLLVKKTTRRARG